MPFEIPIRTTCYILCMEHHGYTRNASAVFSLKYHLVFCPKYRKSVLLGLVAERLKALLATKAAALHVTLHTLEVMPDYVHIFVESDPGMPPAKLAAQFKGDTSRIMRQEFRRLRSQLSSLWSRSYGIWTDGQWQVSLMHTFVAHQPRRS